MNLLRSRERGISPRTRRARPRCIRGHLAARIRCCTLLYNHPSLYYLTLLQLCAHLLVSRSALKRMFRSRCVLCAKLPRALPELTNRFLAPRNNSQKPDDELINRFRRTFADVVPRRGSNEHAVLLNEEECQDPMMPSRYASPRRYSSVRGFNFGHRTMEGNDMKIPPDCTPRNLQDLNFTPSFMDAESFNMMPLAPRHPGIFTPNSGGVGAIYHSQAGDLHAPTLGLNTITPLSLSIPMANAPQPNGFGQFNPQSQYFSQNIPDMNPYAQQASFAPSAFLQRESGYETMHESPDGRLNEMQNESTSNATNSTDFTTGQVGMSYTDGEK